MEIQKELIELSNSKTNTIENSYDLVMENITKTFLNGKIVANANITLKIKKNEIHSIVGENGSGKSTLMSILFGLYKQDKGNIILNGKKIDMYHAGATKKYKIGMVHQHFHLMDKFSILDNIILGQEDKYQKMGFINYKEAKKHFEEISKKYKFNLDPYTKVKKLNVGQKQKVEILKVLWEEKNILVFDEPTATLSLKEIDDLLKIIQSLKDDGKTIIFISHKLQEVKNISDTITILNKGVWKGTFPNTSNLLIKEITNLMFSTTEEPILDFKPKEIIKNKVVLKVENLTYDTSSKFRALDDISFEIYEGEIFGLAGIEGNGQEEIINCVTGLKKAKIGKIFVSNEQIQKLSISKRNLKISHIPIDRIKYGIAPEMSIKFNSVITDLNNKKYGKLNLKILKNPKNIILDNKTIEEHTLNIIKDFNVDGAKDINNQIKNLSGGNQQKFLIGREINKKHSLLIAGHPTRGLDVQAINNIYQNIINNSPKKATLLYSLEISELMSVCDRIAILYKGKIIDIIDPKITTMELVSNLMIGEKHESV